MLSSDNETRREPQPYAQVIFTGHWDFERFDGGYPGHNLKGPITKLLMLMHDTSTQSHRYFDVEDGVIEYAYEKDLDFSSIQTMPEMPDPYSIEGIENSGHMTATVTGGVQKLGIAKETMLFKGVMSEIENETLIQPHNMYAGVSVPSEGFPDDNWGFSEKFGEMIYSYPFGFATLSQERPYHAPGRLDDFTDKWIPRPNILRVALIDFVENTMSELQPGANSVLH